MNKQLTPHFTRREFECRCCGLCHVDAALLSALERFRVWLNKPIRVNSGCRCEAHNRAVGGEPKSLHIATKTKPCRAVDLFVLTQIKLYDLDRELKKDNKNIRMPARELMRKAEEWELSAIWTGRGIYTPEQFVHLDVGRLELRRWERTNGVYKTVGRFV